ncbi:Uncharacterised protein [Mycobacteroides abscessus subsp. abscessus]|nr:Uncharacterised protein [Mycobacteroides abscessus subsp. abscessus]
MSDDDLGQIDALLAQHALRDEARAGVRVGVHGDRSAGLNVCLADGPHHAFDAGRQSLLLDGALEERGLHVGVGDSLGEVTDKEVHQRLVDVEEQPGAGVVELEGNVVVGVEAGCHHDVQVDLVGDLLDAGDVAAETEHRRVEDGVDTETLELAQIAHRVGDLAILVPVVLIVLSVLLAEDEDVLVDEC